MTYDVPIASETTSQEIKTIAKDIKQKVTNNTAWNGNGDTYNWGIKITLNTDTYDENGNARPSAYYLNLNSSTGYNEQKKLSNFYGVYCTTVNTPKTVTHLRAQVVIKDVSSKTLDFQIDSNAATAADRYMPVTEEFVIDLRRNVANSVYITKDFYFPKSMVQTYRDYNSIVKNGVFKDIYSFQHVDTQFLQWLLELHRAGRVNLWDRWKIGDKRDLVLTESDGTLFGKFSLVLCSDHYSDYIQPGDANAYGVRNPDAKPIFAFIFGASTSFACPYAENGEGLTQYSQSYLYKVLCNWGASSGWCYKRVGVDDYEYNGTAPQMLLMHLVKQFRALSYDYNHNLVRERGLRGVPPLQEEIDGIAPDGTAASHNIMMVPYQGSPMLWTREIIDNGHAYASNGDYKASDGSSALNRPGFIVQLA